MKNDPITISYILIDKTIRFQNLKAYLWYLTPIQQEQIMRYRLEVDKITHLIAKLLILRQASQYFQVSPSQIQIAYQPLGKPYLPKYPNYQFSISHSNRCVAFVGADQSIGLDVEYVENRNEEIANAYFAPKEFQYYIRNNSSSMAFYKIWTQKEAYVKMLGTGMSMPLLSFDVREEKLKKILWSTYQNGYWFSICTPSLPKREVILNPLSLSELLKSFS